MKKKVVYKLSIPLTHATSVYDNNTLFPKLSKVRILPKAANYAKKAAFEGAWVRHVL
jgi:hypothetical protein